ncbi:MAG TPA: hypothetical protein VF125_06030 [Solirubrobacterales bacterium]
MTPTDHIELRAQGRLGLRFLARLGDGPAVPSGGVGGWEVVSRPRRRPLTAWRGTPEPMRLSIPVLIDGWPSQSVESDIQALIVMGGMTGDDRKPPLLTLLGDVPYNLSRRPDLRWVIEGLEWGAYTRRDGDDARVRQAVTINLMVPEEDDRIKRLKPRQAADRAHTVTAPKGSTYEKVAAKYLGAKRLGGRLAKYNGARSPDVEFKNPRTVKLPPNSVVAEWNQELGGAAIGQARFA